MYQLVRLAALGLGLATASCQLLAGIETREADPLAAKCALPQPVTGSGRVRLAHLLPTNDKVDVCLRPTGAAAYGRPVLRSSGIDLNNICGGGLSYSKVTTPFRAAPGKTDVKIIAAGKTCTAPAIAEKTGIDVGPDLVITLALMGGGEVAPTIFALPEAPRPTDLQQNRKNRFVNAIAGTALQFGVGVGDKLPTTITAARFNSKALEFGQVPSKDERGTLNFSFDDYGYLTIVGTELSCVAAQRGSDKAMFLAKVGVVGNVTLFAIGDLGGRFPIRGLLCRDNESDPTDATGATADCTASELESFSIDVFNAGLYGAFAAVESARASDVIQALAQRGATSDLLCVSEIARHEGMDLPDEQKEWTQEKLIALAQEVPDGFRYFAQAKTNLDSAITDPNDQLGNTPPAPGRTPCDASVDANLVNDAYTCLETNCSTTGNTTGITQGGTTCYGSKCAGALAQLLYGDTMEKRQCYDCLLLNGLSYKTWEKNRQLCATDPRRPYGFDGQTTSMLLSKLPLMDVDQYVLSSTVFRRTAVYAKMQYEGEKTLDVYCVHAPPLLGAQVAYTGAYANMASLDDGSAWYEEQAWGIQNFANWVKKKSEGRPAIIMGDFSSSKQPLDANGMVILGADGLPIVGNVNPQTINIMQADFLEAFPVSTPAQPYTPQCTRCPSVRSMGLTNPYNTGFIDPQWTLHVFLKDSWVDNPAVSAGLFYNELDRVTINHPTFGLVGPLSDTFGYNVRIRRP
ncbi:MAG TPA: hypothetical protein VK540_01485 [Polyangiaceae bacterium]|nr:hypothetical protein [Polyangiaceae bacterium]